MDWDYFNWPHNQICHAVANGSQALGVSVKIRGNPRKFSYKNKHLSFNVHHLKLWFMKWFSNQVLKFCGIAGLFFIIRHLHVCIVDMATRWPTLKVDFNSLIWLFRDTVLFLFDYSLSIVALCWVADKMNRLLALNVVLEFEIRTKR